MVPSVRLVRTSTACAHVDVAHTGRMANWHVKHIVLYNIELCKSTRLFTWCRGTLQLRCSATCLVAVDKIVLQSRLPELQELQQQLSAAHEEVADLRFSANEQQGVWEQQQTAAAERQAAVVKQAEVRWQWIFLPALDRSGVLAELSSPEIVALKQLLLLLSFLVGVQYEKRCQLKQCAHWNDAPGQGGKVKLACSAACFAKQDVCCSFAAPGEQSLWTAAQDTLLLSHSQLQCHPLFSIGFMSVGHISRTSHSLSPTRSQSEFPEHMHSYAWFLTHTHTHTPLRLESNMHPCHNLATHPPNVLSQKKP